jgi:hypothetical protein
VGATTVIDMWVRMAYLKFSIIIMAWFKLSLSFSSFDRLDVSSLSKSSGRMLASTTRSNGESQYVIHEEHE